MLLRFFGGFGFKDDVRLFKPLLNEFGYFGAYSVCGFSKGAQKALDFSLHYKMRINRLILLSPAFFNHKDSAFKAMQIRQFQKHKKIYMDKFYKNVGISEKSAFLRHIDEVSFMQLEECLNYHFSEEKLQTLQKNGIEIVVFLGENDKIIDSKIAYNFFRTYGIVYFIKNANHLLKRTNNL